MKETDKGLYVEAYRSAYDFLLSKIPSKLPGEIIEQYLNIPEVSASNLTLESVFRRLILSAQNANMKAGVVGGSIGGVDNLSPLLFGFSPSKVHEYYQEEWQKLLAEIEEKLKPMGKMRRTPRSIWPNFCESVLTGAKFLTQFKTGKDFFEWADHLYNDKRSMAALPLILSQEIHGYGYPLACDFLKELGFLNYGKPDVHIKDIFHAIGLIEEKSTPYQIQKVISDFADAVGVTSYNIDKLFWLIGSGEFYNNHEFGSKGNIGRNKKEFIQFFLSRELNRPLEQMPQ